MSKPEESMYLYLLSQKDEQIKTLSDKLKYHEMQKLYAVEVIQHFVSPDMQPQAIKWLFSKKG